MQNLLPEPPATLLPDEPEAALDLAAAGDPATVAAAHPAYSAAWAALAERAMAGGDAVTAYAFARTGYHRGLDQLRRNGWRGSGPVPWSHEANRGFLRCLYYLGQAAQAIGETDEAERCAQFLRDCDPAAAEALA
jgi:tetratricopeptide (TPR) repeat protein